MVPAPNNAHVALRLFSNYVVTVIIVFILLRIFPGLGRVEVESALWAILAGGALSVVLWPLLIRLFLVFFRRLIPIITLALFSLVSLLLPALILYTLAWLSPGFSVAGFGAALVISGFMAAVSLVFAAIFASDDESLIYQWLLKRLAIGPGNAADRKKSGIIFLEIDGLSSKMLEAAMQAGKLPTLKKWTECGSHRIVTWHSDLSSQSASAQAGILHGNNFGIPGFRWYDKARKEIIVSTSISDVSRLEKSLSNGNGLLSGGGAARASLFSGDAPRVLLTASKAYDNSAGDPGAYFAYYMNPSNTLRSFFLMVWDWLLEKKAAWGQKLRDEQPRINRGGAYFLERSLITVLVKEIALSALRGDMYAGVPSVYVTLAGYDEVSHHSGIARPDALEVLRKLDKDFRKLEKIALEGTRRYKFVVLSDHGSTQGLPFEDRYGESLVDVVRRLMRVHGKQDVAAGANSKHEDFQYAGAALRDYEYLDSKIGERLGRRLEERLRTSVGASQNSEVIVLASGNMGHISFTRFPSRLSLEEIERLSPELIPGLVTHPGIGFTLVHSGQQGGLVLGKTGQISLSTGEVRGEDPLAAYGPHTFANVARFDLFPNAPDIMVMSTYWPETDEVAAFQEFVASHGGAGGGQSHPFIIYPVEYSPGDTEIVGAEQVHRIFKRWRREAERL
jgi:hypothetical protein